MIEKNNFKGLFPLFIEFNNGLYQIFQAAPSYIGKFFIGLFYGLILGFILACWKDEIIKNIFLISSSIWIFSLFDCITINWDKIYCILGYSGQLSYNQISTFFSRYCLEIGVTSLVTILVYMTVVKYKGYREK